MEFPQGSGVPFITPSTKPVISQSPFRPLLYSSGSALGSGSPQVMVISAGGLLKVGAGAGSTVIICVYVNGFPHSSLPLYS